jgi:predicted Zn-ribbon and HTH transcriptional regulator
MNTCPHCWSIQIERTHRKPWERLLSRFGIFPFTCNECGYRFHSRLVNDTPAPSPHT